MKRILFVDVFRGIAVLQMIFWQIFDFFARADIYTGTPYKIAALNMPINGIGVGLFAFISGFCVYMSVKKREKMKKLEILKQIAKRYGLYILVSLILCIVVFEYTKFIGWREALQGIGLAALATGTILIFTRSVYPIAALGLSIILFQGTIRQYLVMDLGIFNIFLNATFMGWFSLANLLPIAIFGALCSYVYSRIKRNEFIKKIGLIGILIIGICIVLHIAGYKIDYYNRSLAYLLLYVGFPMLVLVVLMIITKKNMIFNVLDTFGKTALFAYLLHFIIILKPLEIFGISYSFPTAISYAFSLASIVVIYYLSKAWIKTRRHFGIRLI